MKPALTAEEWREGYDSPDLSVRLRNSMGTVGYRVDVNPKAHPLGGMGGDLGDLHALAALCLHGQPFGFTREDVELLGHAAAVMGSVVFSPRSDSRVECDSADMANELAKKAVGDLHDLANRIEALLPPEE